MGEMAKYKVSVSDPEIHTQALKAGLTHDHDPKNPSKCVFVISVPVEVALAHNLTVAATGDITNMPPIADWSDHEKAVARLLIANKGDSEKTLMAILMAAAAKQAAEEAYAKAVKAWKPIDQALRQAKTPAEVDEILAQAKAQGITKPAGEYYGGWSSPEDLKRKIQQTIEAEEKAKAEAERKQRYAKLPWVKALTKKLAVSEEAHSEISRFCQKFSLAPEDLTVQNISDRPYVRLVATVPIQVAGMERNLKISNRTYEDVGKDEYDQYKPAEFSDLALEIAKVLAEIFSGQVVTICNYERGEAWLNVVTEGDTIEVASCDLERED